MKPLTSYIAVTGRIAPKSSPWARPISSAARDVGDEHPGPDDVGGGRADALQRGDDGAQRDRHLLARRRRPRRRRRRRPPCSRRPRRAGRRARRACSRRPLERPGRPEPRRSISLTSGGSAGGVVKTIATPACSAAATTSSSRTEPPGWMIAVTPASIASSGPSAKGKNASEASAAPFSESACGLLDRRGAPSRRGSSGPRRCRASRGRGRARSRWTSRGARCARRTAGRPTPPRTAGAR